jgi:hypothetical protein
MDTIKDGANVARIAAGLALDLYEFGRLDASGQPVGRRWDEEKLRGLWLRLYKGQPPDRGGIVADIVAHIARLERDYAARAGGTSSVVVGGTTEEGIG